MHTRTDCFFGDVTFAIGAMLGNVTTRNTIRFLIFALLLIVVVGRVSAETPTATFYVNNFADVGDASIDGVCDSNLVLAGQQCTLRAAVDEANATTAQDFIDLTAGTYNLTSSLTLRGVVQISGNGIIDGADQHDIRITRLTPTSGNATFFGVTLRDLTGLTCSTNDGCVKLSLLLTTIESSTGDDGGALTIQANELYLEEATLQNNSATDNGGAIWARVDKLTILRSTISNNSAAGIGGGLYVWPRGTNPFEMVIEQTTIDGNSAENGGGIYITDIGSAGNVTKEIVIEQSTLSNNTAGGATAGNQHGGGLYLWSDATIVNSTISGNRANDNGGGIYFFAGELDLHNVTITDNTADVDVGNDGQGGGLMTQNDPATIYSSVIAGNEDMTDGIVDLYAADCAGEINSGGHNLIGQVFFTYCTFNDLPTDQFSTNTPLDPRVAALTNNGGLTTTHMPNSDSPLINAGGNCNDPNAQPLTRDQRGLNRVQQGACDIGAVESPYGVPTAVGLVGQSAETQLRWILLLVLVILTAMTWTIRFTTY